MPSVAVSKRWFVRITKPHAELRQKLKLMSEWVDKVRVIAVLHLPDNDNDNEHAHFCIELSSELQKQSFDKRLNKHFDVKGTAQFCSKPWDGKDEACSYLFHENGLVDDALVLRIGFTDEDIDRFKKLNEHTQKIVKANKEKASCKTVDKLISWANEKGGTISLEDLWIVAMKLIREGSLHHPGDYRLKTMVQTAYLRISPSSEFENYALRQFQSVFKELYS